MIDERDIWYPTGEQALLDQFRRAIEAGIQPTFREWLTWPVATQDMWLQAKALVESVQRALTANMIADSIRGGDVASSAVFAMLPEETQDAILLQRLERKVAASEVQHA